MENLAPGDPQRIGGYRLLGRLGAGGMGQVYLARSDQGRMVAVKLVRPELAARDEFRARFRQEVRSAQRVGGYWTAPVVDADTEAAVPWVATGYVAGPSLLQVVDRDHGPLPERSVRILAAGLAHALTNIHAAGIVHRDLKPSNVMVTIEGPRVIDFGVARALERLPGAGAVLGPSGFLAPEQVRGERITPACDVFCLGSVLAYAATGTLPFGSASASADVMSRIAEGEPDLRGLPEGIADLVQTCLRKDPATRPTLAWILDHTGADDTVSEGRSRDPWLPGTLVAQLGRHAVRLADAQGAAEHGGRDMGLQGDASGSGVGAAGGAPGSGHSRSGAGPGGGPASGHPGSGPGAASAAGRPGQGPWPGGAPGAGHSGSGAGPGGGSASGHPGSGPGAASAAGRPGQGPWPGGAPGAGHSGSGAAPGGGSASGHPESGAWPPGGGPVHPAYGVPPQHPQPAYGYPRESGPWQGGAAGVSAPGPAPHNPYAQPPNPPNPLPPPHLQPPTPYGYGGAPDPEEPESPRRSGRTTALLIAIALVVALAAGGSVYAFLNGGDEEPTATPAPTRTSTAPTPTEPSPTASASPSPSPSRTTDGAIPEAYLGTWTAAVDSETGSDSRRLTLKQGEVGDTVLTLIADGAGYHCEFAAALTRRPADNAPLRIGPSTVTTGTPSTSCTPGDPTEVTLLPDGRLQRTNTTTGEKLTYSR